MDDTVLIYRLVYSTAGQETSPAHLWGTLEAISHVEGFAPILSTARPVPRSALDAQGFLFEHAYIDFVDITSSSHPTDRGGESSER